MAGSAADSTLYRGLFGQPEMQAVFSDAALVTHWLRVEAALARAEARAGVVPRGAADAIAAAAERLRPDLDELGNATTHVGYPIVGLVQALADACGPDHAHWVHWGATTQDIMDTATVLQVRDARALLRRQLIDLGVMVGGLVRTHRDTPMPGRTHGQHAVPTTFGCKAAGWLAELGRHLDRLDECAPRIQVAQLGGGAGTLASLGADGSTVRRLFAEELGLGTPVPWHSARDGLTEFALLVGLVGATLGKVAREIATLARTEIGEVEEGFLDGRGASSTMPQKRNPILAETITALARLAAHEAGGSYGWMQVDNERAMGEWHLEWDALPRVCIAASAALAHSARLLRELVVNREHMRANLALTGGAINAEAVMMRLAPQVGRQRAHEIVYAAAMLAHDSGSSFLSTLIADAEVRRHVGERELTGLLDASSYLGLAGEFCDQALAEWESRAATDGGLRRRPGSEHPEAVVA